MKLRKLLALAIGAIFFILAGCVGGLAEDTPEDTPEDTLYETSPEGLLRLGDSFMYQAIKVTPGEAIKFVSYTNTLDVNSERGTFPSWRVEDFEKAIYIPVTFYDTGNDVQLTGQYRWMLMDSTSYYSPDSDNRNVGLWRNPGGDGIISEMFPWDGQYEPFAETHIRLAYTVDGEYILRFVLRESDWNSPIKETLEFPIGIKWPELPTLVTVAIIERQPNERVTNIGNTYAHLSALAPYRLNSNACFPQPITRIAYNGAAIPLLEAPALPPGASMQFYLPIDAFVCENSAIFRPFRFSETRTDESGNITIIHNHYEFCLPGCSWCDDCGEE